MRVALLSVPAAALALLATPSPASAASSAFYVNDAVVVKGGWRLAAEVCAKAYNGWYEIKKYDGPAVDIRFRTCDNAQEVVGWASLPNADPSSTWVYANQGDRRVYLEAFSQGNNWMDTWYAVVQYQQ
ncbi:MULTISPECIES: hypothetical protein [unclassified Streptomyces]|uniref:hypothetical protein n=1 Tax=unclassified Streptomyces TaxID=2593676 RepID=UPI00382CE5C4